MRLPVDTRSATSDPVPAEPIVLRGIANAAGVCTLTTSPVGAGYKWLLDYLTITATPVAGKISTSPTFDVYVDQATPAQLIDGSQQGAGAVAAYVPPRVVPQGSALLFIWTGCNPGDACSVRVEYRRQNL